MKIGMFVVASAGAVAVLARQALRRLPNVGAFAPVVAVNRSVEEVSTDTDVARLVAEGRLRVSTAPGGRGAVLSGTGEHGAKWERLRGLEQVLETGEVLRVDGQPHGRRTLPGRALDRTGRTMREGQG